MGIIVSSHTLVMRIKCKALRIVPGHSMHYINISDYY